MLLRALVLRPLPPARVMPRPPGCPACDVGGHGWQGGARWGSQPCRGAVITPSDLISQHSPFRAVNCSGASKESWARLRSQMGTASTLRLSFHFALMR